MSAGDITLILLVLGGLFLFFELFLPSFGALGVTGLIFLLVGFGTYTHDGVYQAVLTHWDWLVVLALAGILIAAFIGFIAYRTNKIKPMTGREDLVAKEVDIIEWHGQQGKVAVDGEIWIAFSDEPYNFSKGDNVLIAQVKHLKLRIIPK